MSAEEDDEVFDYDDHRDEGPSLAPKIRRKFPETWIWDTLDRDDGLVSTTFPLSRCFGTKGLVIWGLVHQESSSIFLLFLLSSCLFFVDNDYQVYYYKGGGAAESAFFRNDRNKEGRPNDRIPGQEDSQPVIRKNFLETWIWDLFDWFVSFLRDPQIKHDFFFMIFLQVFSRIFYFIYFFIDGESLSAINRQAGYILLQRFN